MSKFHTLGVAMIADLLSVSTITQAANLPTITGSQASYDLVIEPQNGVILRRSNFSPKRIDDVDSVIALLKH